MVPPLLRLLLVLLFFNGVCMQKDEEDEDGWETNWRPSGENGWEANWRSSAWSSPLPSSSSGASSSSTCPRPLAASTPLSHAERTAYMSTAWDEELSVYLQEEEILDVYSASSSTAQCVPLGAPLPDDLPLPFGAAVLMESLESVVSDERTAALVNDSTYDDLWGDFLGCICVILFGILPLYLLFVLLVPAEIYDWYFIIWGDFGYWGDFFLIVLLFAVLRLWGK
eukprot:s260_g16.t1